jgi:hypothetical protein
MRIGGPLAKQLISAQFQKVANSKFAQDTLSREFSLGAFVKGVATITCKGVNVFKNSKERLIKRKLKVC